MADSHRRDFLKHAGIGVAAATAANLAGVLRADETKPGKRAAKSDAGGKIVMAWIGCGGQATNLLKSFGAQPDVAVAYVCDPEASRAAAAAQVGRKPDRQGAEDRVRHAPRPRRQIGRRRLRRHARPLARPGHDPGLRRRQARLCRKALLAQHSRGAADGRSRAAEQARRAGRHAEPQFAGDHRRHASCCATAPSASPGRQGLEQPAPRRHRPRRSPARSPTASTTTSGSGRRRLSRFRPTGSITAGTGGTTSAPATWATTASTTSTSPAGDWGSRRIRR